MQPGPGQPQQVDNNMTMSIVSIFLFWPLAIPALINASKVNSLLQVGDVAGAQAASVESKKWSRLALIVGIVAYALCCIGYILIFVVAAASSTAI